MAIELKTDSRHRYMMYRRDEFHSSIFPTEDEKAAIDAGKQYAARAHADVWANDPDLVRRVRAFLGENFHWHDRLAKSGSDFEVVEALMDMVRGESVVLKAIDPPRYGGGYASPFFQSLEQVPHTRTTRPEVNRSSWIPSGPGSYVKWYDAAVAQHSAFLKEHGGIGRSVADAKTLTPLGNATPFEYDPPALVTDVTEIAARGVDEAHEALCEAQYEIDLAQCSVYGAMRRDPYTYFFCKQRAFERYNQCRGY